MEVKQIHAGQKNRYGDSFYEYIVTSDLPREEVEKYCREVVRKAISHEEYKATMTDFGSHFREHYFLKERKPGEWLYQVVSPYAD